MSSNNIIPVWKPVGVTPLQMIEVVQEKIPSLQDATIGYAGRLDPLAEGVLLLTVDQANADRKQYEQLDKQYRFEVLFGMQTDSYDLMGLFTADPAVCSPTQELVHAHCLESIGSFQQPYPPFSAVRVNGKPLYYWARHGKLDRVAIPEKNVTVTEYRLLSLNSVSGASIADLAIQNVSLVSGQFRQQSIIDQWRQFANRHASSSFSRAELVVSCSTGTYVRGLAHALGTTLGCGAVCSRIIRESVGAYTAQSCTI